MTLALIVVSEQRCGKGFHVQAGGSHDLNFPKEEVLGLLLCLHVRQEEKREAWGSKTTQSNVKNGDRFSITVKFKSKHFCKVVRIRRRS